jgi:hypothetical protein
MSKVKNREVFFLKIWEGRDTIVGCEIGVSEFQATWNAAENPIKWSFHGLWASVMVISQENDITRHDALLFATNWMKGNVVHYAVDLDRCTVQITKGIEKPPTTNRGVEK